MKQPYNESIDVSSEALTLIVKAMVLCTIAESVRSLNKKDAVSLAISFSLKVLEGVYISILRLEKDSPVCMYYK